MADLNFKASSTAPAFRMETALIPYRVRLHLSLFAMLHQYSSIYLTLGAFIRNIFRFVCNVRVSVLQRSESQINHVSLCMMLNEYERKYFECKTKR